MIVAAYKIENPKDAYVTSVCLVGGHTGRVACDYHTFMAEWRSALSLDESDLKELQYRILDAKAELQAISFRAKCVNETVKDLVSDSLARSVKDWILSGAQYPKKALKDEWLKMIDGDSP